MKIADMEEQNLVNTRIVEETLEGENVYRTWNNFFQWYFQHIESKTKSFLRHNKVILAFGL